MEAHKLPSGKYRAQVRYNGKRYSFTAKKKSDAEDKAKTFLEQKADITATPLGEAIDEYITIKENVLSPATIRGYKSIRKNNLQDLMDIPVRDLTSESVQRSVNRMAIKKAPKTVRNAVGLVTATISIFAPNMHINITLPKRKPIEYSIPTTKELNLLLDNSGRNMRTAIMLAAFCSLRRGEVVALESSDIDGNIIHVCRNTVRNADNELITKTPKTYKSDRYVLAPDILIDHIKGIEGQICPMKPGSITGLFRRACIKVGLNCRFHDLRHYFASINHALLVPDQYIMQAGGWKSDAVLKRVYRNTLSDMEKKYAQKTNRYFQKNVTQSAHADRPSRAKSG